MKPSANLAINSGSSFGIVGSAFSDSHRLGSTEKPPRLGMVTLWPVRQWLHFPHLKDDDIDDADVEDAEDEEEAEEEGNDGAPSK